MIGPLALGLLVVAAPTAAFTKACCTIRPVIAKATGSMFCQSFMSVRVTEYVRAVMDQVERRS